MNIEVGGSGRVLHSGTDDHRLSKKTKVKQGGPKRKGRREEERSAAAKKVTV